MDDEFQKSCIDCVHHKIIQDPDPNDWFCDDDVALVCTLTLNPNQDMKSIWMSDRSEYRSVGSSIRPYRVRKETDVPDWCPK